MHFHLQYIQLRKLNDIILILFTDLKFINLNNYL